MRITRALTTFGIFVAVSAAALPASAKPGAQTIVFTEQGAYACDGPCATATNFVAWGTLHASGSGLGVLRESLQGTVVDYDPATNCLDQVEQWTVTTQGGKDALSFTTDSDTFCFTDDPNVNHETATFTLTGGAGKFRGAVGTGSLDFTVLSNPQIAYGTVTVELTG